MLLRLRHRRSNRFYNPYVTWEYPADYGRYVYRPYG
jgi:hypothetical protein